MPSGLEAFPYDLLPAVVPASTKFADAARADSLLQDPVADVSSREALAQQQGREQGQAEARCVFDEQLVRERNTLSEALARFTRDRATYFEKVEGEVVQLALAIARKILHREVQLDPLLLAGIVRVTLEKMDSATGVVLRLHPQHAADWRQYLSTRLDLADMPQIVEDPSQPLDRCMLETSMGTTAIGLEVQLKEIEQGLMDLLAARPGSGS